MKILMVNLPFSGHSNPTMGLAKELVELGHEVAYILSYEWEQRVLDTGCKFIPYLGSTPIKYKKMELNYWRVAYETVKLELPNYDVLIYEMLFFPGKSLADELGKSAIRLFSTFALNANILHEFGMTGGPYFTALFKYKLLYKIISKLVSKSFKLKQGDLVKELTENIPETNFVYTIREFQIDNETFSKAHFHFIGPSVSDRKAHITQIDFDNMEHPIVYISMGTLINQSKKFYQKCFDAFGDKKITVIISLGHSMKKETFKHVPGNIHLYSFVPQLEVLKNCDLFITHGGMNSVNEAIYYGVPMLVIPVGNDQPTVAKRVEQLNLGKKLSAKKLTAEILYREAVNVMIKTNKQSVLDEFKTKSQNAGGNKLAAKILVEHIEKLDNNT